MVNAAVPADSVRSVHVSVAGGLCAIAHNTTTHIVDVQSGRSTAVEVQYVARAVAVNADGTLVAVAGDGKVVDLFKVNRSGNGAIEAVPSRRTDAVSKRIINLLFDASGNLLVGDKFGEIFRCTPETDFALTPASKPILSHMGMVTALAKSGAANALVTADRDGNVRVSSHRLPDDILGFLWLPLEDSRRLNCKDAVTAALGWATPHVLVTGTLDGVVAAWDLSRPSIDQSNALASVPVSHGRPIVGFVQCPKTGALFAAVDGDSQLRPAVGAAAPLSLSSPVVAADGSVVLHRDGHLSILSDAGLKQVPVFRLISEDLATLDVKTLWHTREWKQQGGDAGEKDDDEDELPEPAGKRPPRAEAAEQ